MLKLEKPVVFVDIESTGTSTTDDKIVEISCVKLMPDMERIIKTYRINPGIPIPPGATEVHGITDEDVKDQPIFKRLANGLMDFITGCDLAGFKSNHFDFPMLYSEFSNAGVTWDYTLHNFIDVGNIFQIKEPRTLAAAVKFYCGKELEGAHGAQADIEATIDVFIKQTEMYEDLPNTMTELDLYSNYGNKRLDMAGKFVFDKDGKTILFNFGKDKGKPATDYGFLNWMVYKANFPPDTTKIALQLMNEIPFK
jgi:DNA polymerase III subunit epsilon